MCSVIVISQLVRFTDVLVTFGLTLENILMPFLFVLVPFLSITIPMAYTFAVFISFNRLSSDGEFTAMLASGYSLNKAARPIIILGIALYFIGAYCSLNFEAWGRRETLQFYHRKTQTKLDNMIKVKMKSGVFLNDFLGYVLYAEEVSKDKTTFKNVLLAPGVATDDQNFSLMAPKGRLLGSVTTRDLRMSFDQGIFYMTDSNSKNISIVKFKKAQLDLLRIFRERIYGPDLASDDYRSYPPVKLWEYVDSIKNHKNKSTYYKARFLLYQRIGMPFTVIAFALFAMVLGIQDDRRGKSLGYIGVILTLIAGYILIMSFKWISERGSIPAPLGIGLPNAILLSIGAFLLYQKNRLPLSESTLNPRFFPLIGRWFTKKSLRDGENPFETA